MRSVNKMLLKFLFSTFCCFFLKNSFAQDATATTKNTGSSNNLAVILMAVIAFLLAFVIWGMGQVLVTVARQAMEKNKQSINKTLVVVMVIGFSLLSLSSNATEKSATEAVATIPDYGMDSTVFWMLSIVISIEVLVILFMLFSIRRIQTELLPPTQQQKMLALKDWWARWDKRLFTKAVSIEKEADILLDHDYDGIRELDNALPPWWKYGFIITIVIAFIYLLNFHVLGYGMNPTEEYLQEMVKAKEAKELYDSKNADKVDEANLKMPDAAGINAAKEIFSSVCWACHGKLGEGGAGPNLTDESWIHKGSLTDIYQSIKHGYPDKGMQSWEKNYSPKEINYLAGFVKTLRGTNPPNAKAPQGDLFTEAVAVDSIAIGKKESLPVNKN